MHQENVEEDEHDLVSEISRKQNIRQINVMGKATPNQLVDYPSYLDFNPDYDYQYDPDPPMHLAQSLLLQHAPPLPEPEAVPQTIFSKPLKVEEE